MRAYSLALALTIGAAGIVSAVPASAGQRITEWWQGSWNTSTVLIHLQQNDEKVTGKYKSGPGCIGRIEARTEGPVGERMEGTFDDNCSGGNHGKLKATVNIDETPLTFRGKFCQKTLGVCGSWVKWTGTHR